MYFLYQFVDLRMAKYSENFQPPEVLLMTDIPTYWVKLYGFTVDKYESL